MILEFSIYQIIGTIAIFNAMFLAIFSFTLQRGNLRANKILGIIYCVFGLLIFDSLLLTYGLSPKLIIIFLIVSLFSLLLGPLVFFYSKAYLVKNWKLRKRDSLHFIAFLLLLSYLIIKIYVFHDTILWRSNVRKFGNFLILIHLLIYIVFTLKEIIKHISLKKFISLAGRDNIFGHISFFILAFIFIWISKLHIFLVLDVWNRYGFCPYMYSIYFTSAFIFINLFMFFYMNNSYSKKRKFALSSLISDEKRLFYKKIIDKELFEAKIYKDPEITLRKLSEFTEIPYSYLSDFINREYKLNFRELINKCRIEDAINLILFNNNKQKTFLEIAYEVGFNSKSTFNLAFKKYQGMNPSDFLNYHKKES